MYSPKSVHNIKYEVHQWLKVEGTDFLHIHIAYSVFGCSLSERN